MKPFRFFNLFILSLMMSMAHSTKQIWGVAETECIDELKLDKTTVQDFDTKRDPEASEDFNSFLLCSWKKKGIEKGDGAINWEKIYEILFDEFQIEFKEKSKIITLLGGELVEDAIRRCNVKFSSKESSDNNDYSVTELRQCVKSKLEENLNDLDSVKDYSNKLFYKVFTY